MHNSSVPHPHGQPAHAAAVFNPAPACRTACRPPQPPSATAWLRLMRWQPQWLPVAALPPPLPRPWRRRLPATPPRCARQWLRPRQPPPRPRAALHKPWPPPLPAAREAPSCACVTSSQVDSTLISQAAAGPILTYHDPNHDLLLGWFQGVFLPLPPSCTAAISAPCMAYLVCVCHPPPIRHGYVIDERTHGQLKAQQEFME